MGLRDRLSGDITETPKVSEPIGTGLRARLSKDNILKPTKSISGLSVRLKKDKGISEERGWLESILSGLDFLGNISRSAIKGAIEKDETVFGNIADAAAQKLQTTPGDLKDSVTEALGLGKIRFGKDDGKFQWGDLGDFATDVAVDLATDPLTWISGGLTKVGKLGAKNSTKTLRKLSSMMTANKRIKTLDNSSEILNLNREILDKAVKAKSKTAAAKILRQEGGLSSKATRELFEKTDNAAAIARRAKQYQVFSGATRAGMGGIYGYSATDPDESFTRHLINTAIGAGFVYGGGKYAPGAGKMIKKSFDSITDAYGKKVFGIGEEVPIFKAKAIAKSRAKEFIKRDDFAKGLHGDLLYDQALQGATDSIVEDLVNPLLLSDAYKHIATGIEKKQGLMREILQSRGEVLKGLNPVEKVSATKTMRYLKDEFLKRRNKALDDAGIVIKRKGAINPDDLERFNTITKQVENSLTEDLPSLLKNESKDIANAVTRWTIHNKKWIDRYNKETGKNLIGIKFHVDDVFSPNDFKEVDNLVKSHIPKWAKVHAAKGYEVKDKLPAHLALSDELAAKKVNDLRTSMNKQIDDYIADASVKGLSEEAIDNGIKNIQQPVYKQIREIADNIVATPEAIDASYKIYAENMIHGFLNKKERQALRIMSQMRKVDPTQPGYKLLHNSLKTYDRLLNFAKANMLGFSLSWIKNNYWDNMIKAYTETGLMGAAKVGKEGVAALLAPFGKGSKIGNALNDLYKGGIKKFPNEDLERALKYGVVETGFYRDFKDIEQRTIDFMKGPVKLADEVGEEGSKNLLQKGGAAVGRVMDKWQRLLEGTTFKIGQTMEGSARMITFQETINMLRKSGQFAKATDDEIFRIAADITKRTFFDYQNISQFERAFFRRIVPFYSFYSKNIPFWLETATNIEKMGRFANVDKFRRNLGREPTEAEREGLSTYINQNAARFVGRGKGGKKYSIFPYISSYDALQSLNLRKIGDNLSEKVSPFMKAPLELAYDRDWFMGGFLFPSSTRTKSEKLSGKVGKKYLFSRGFKYKWLQDAIKNIPGMETLGDLGVKVDKNGNPIATRDNLVKVDKIFSTLFPMGAVDQLAGAVGKIKHDKTDVVEQLVKFFTPGQVVTQSRAQSDYLKSIRERARKSGKPID